MVRCAKPFGVIPVLVAAILFAVVPSAYAETEPEIMQVYATGQTLTVIADSKNDEEGDTVPEQVSKNFFEKYAAFIGAGVALLLLVTVMIIVVAAKKKKKSASACVSASAPVPAPQYSSAPYSGKTELADDAGISDSEYTIKLSNANNPGNTWTLPVANGLLIGRGEHCAVRLDDRSVSREQCRIVEQSGGLVVVHLSTTNKTTVNGRSVEGNLPLQSGDTLKFGRAILCVDYIQILGSPPPVLTAPWDQGSGHTESMF